MILVDSNVILDVFTEDPRWLDWSSSRLLEHGEERELAVNPIIYAEVAVRFERVEELEAALPHTRFQRLELPYAAGFLAAKSFLAYRQRGGARSSILPDFYIGAHAAIAGLKLLTRDAKRYRQYFPTVELITP